MPAPYKVFTIYAREDASYLDELRGQLRPLEIGGRIKVWSDREINPGVDWEREIVQHLDTADIILILVSAAYYNSAYIHEKEIKYALARHERGEAKVLPIIVRPVDFSDDPVISRLQVLPTDGRPVTDRRHWPERDDAWLDVVAGIKRTISVLLESENRRAQEARDAVLAAEQQEQAATLAITQETERLRQADHAERKHAGQEQLAAEKRAQQAERRRQAAQQQKEAGENLKMAPATAAKSAPETGATPSRLPPVRYAFLVGGGIIALLGFWLAVDLFKDKKEPEQGVRTISPSSLPKNVGVQVNKSGLVMVPVEGGAFMMGSPKNEAGRREDECQHQITVSSFSIGKYEVTQANWHAIMGSNPADFKNCDDCPVEQVSWDDVQDFLQKLNASYAGKNYRLPTESEWEYAARGGTNGKGFKFAGGADLSSVAWSSENSGSKTHPVGGKLPNELGLHDMSGNVWEWCEDTWKPYPGCSGKPDSRIHMLRGGDWSDGAPDCRIANRGTGGPTLRINNVGFRLVSVPGQ